MNDALCYAERRMARQRAREARNRAYEARRRDAMQLGAVLIGGLVLALIVIRAAAWFYLTYMLQP